MIYVDDEDYREINDINIYTKTTCFYEDYISTQQDVEYYNR